MDPPPSSFRGSSDRVSVSPKPTAWKRDARSWYPSGRLRSIRRKRLILQGLKSVSVSSGEDDDGIVEGAVVASGTAGEAADDETTTRELNLVL
jgi:hypothetical protein